VEISLVLEAPEGLPEDQHESQDRPAGKALGVGNLCPHCQEGCLDYDGLLNLACSRCGFALGGCFT
jgi:uncharacterized protein (DUF983 family)